MKIDELLHKLETLNIYVDEVREHHDGSKVLILRTNLPEVPYGHKKPVWATLVLSPGQTDVEREEVDSLLRHLAHGSAFLFGDELARELLPINEKEREIFRRIEALVDSFDGSRWAWEPEEVATNVRNALSFKCGPLEEDYLQFCSTWRNPSINQQVWEKEE